METFTTTEKHSTTRVTIVIAAVAIMLVFLSRKKKLLKFIQFTILEQHKSEMFCPYVDFTCKCALKLTLNVSVRADLNF